MNYGWLGEHQRAYEHTGGLSLVQMGARPYSPLLGRFLSVDPFEGGSANDYDYVAGDPINATDLDGTSWFSSIVSAVTKVAEVVSNLPGPIGAVTSGVAAVGNAIQGNWGAAIMYGFGAITVGVGALAVGAYKAAKFVAKVGPKVNYAAKARVRKWMAKTMNGTKHRVEIAHSRGWTKFDLAGKAP
jgi:RHS repeat-associated protein